MCRLWTRFVIGIALLAAVGLLLVQATVAEEDSGVLTLGDVHFPHELHYAELEIECQTCHHETNAAKLVVPHEEYFEDFWINCTTCHGQTVSKSQTCSSCHHDSPVDLADQTLSAKVVIHRSCWTCHEIGTGSEASQGCKTCHVPAPTATTEGPQP